MLAPTDSRALESPTHVYQTAAEGVAAWERESAALASLREVKEQLTESIEREAARTNELELQIGARAREAQAAEAEAIALRAAVRAAAAQIEKGRAQQRSLTDTVSATEATARQVEEDADRREVRHRPPDRTPSGHVSSSLSLAIAHRTGHLLAISPTGPDPPLASSGT